jgi:hypothetical protein
MLFIEADDEVPLPSKFRELHNVCVHLHDQMADIMTHDGYEPFRNYTLDFSKQCLYIKELQNQEMSVLDFLDANGMHGEMTEVLVRDIVQALLADFLHFIHESLSSAKRGKISVAYALLRKPLVDLLLLFEQMLVNKQEFIDRFYHAGDIEGYDPSVANLDKKSIIEQASAKLPLRVFYVADFIYDLRYDKATAYGLAGATNQALHIVTRDKRYQTRNRDLNFVFVAEDYLEQYWNNYYTVVPYLLSYASAVLDEIVFTMMPENRGKQIKNVQRFLLFAKLPQGDAIQKIALDEQNLFDYLSDHMLHTCKSCSANLRFEKADFNLFSATTMMLCIGCFTDQFEDDDFTQKFQDAWGAVIPS